VHRKKEAKSPEHINYPLLNPNKITFEFLKGHLWSAADILRGSLDPSEYHQPVMTLDIIVLNAFYDKESGILNICPKQSFDCPYTTSLYLVVQTRVIANKRFRMFSTP
jgi:hypothetical protein